MKKKTALIGVCLIAASTIGLTFIQPTIIHQLVIWVAGVFALLVVLGVFLVDSAVSVAPTEIAIGEQGLTFAVRGMREQQLSDSVIARLLKTDIETVKAVK